MNLLYSEGYLIDVTPCHFTELVFFIAKIQVSPLFQNSQAVSHPSASWAQCCLTSVIGRELVHSA